MNELQRVEEQEVRELIAAAGPRAVVPAEEVATITAAARREWQQMVDRQRRRRRRLRVGGGLALAASAVLALAIGWWWAARPARVAAPVVATVELLAGSARAQPPGGRSEKIELAVDGQLTPGSVVETADREGEAPSGAALRLADGQSLRLAAGTRARLVSARRIDLERGALYVDSGTLAAPQGVEVVTALGIVREIGTQFEVRLDPGSAALRVRVREGSCAVEARRDSHLAARGQQLSVRGDGSVVRGEVQPYGPQWAWVVATAPSLEIEGRPLSAFLDWAARELGRGLTYADPPLAGEATGIILHGSIAGLSPAEALDVILKGSGLGHVVEDGTILITR